ncbi:MAG: dihydropteroate synthase [Methanospirillum sp.]|nr:dihydropteroate synthase [Methanospirillum sp.]
MAILFPTGAATEDVVREAVAGLEAEVVVTGEIASFLTPSRLRELLAAGRYDCAVVSGMCTASFAGVEAETGVPVLRGPRHAADLPLMIEQLGTVEFSRDVPADDLLRDLRRDDAYRKVSSIERNADWDLLLRGVRIGGSARCKVLAELMDAHRRADLSGDVARAFREGADIVDLGFGFDATPADVARCFSALDSVDGPLAVDTQDPALIAASLFRADLVLSLQDENIPVIGRAVAESGAAAVVVPRYASLEDNLAAARAAGCEALIADPLLQPVGSGLVRSLGEFRDYGVPLFFGAGNVVELLDADSPGAQALLAGMAQEVGAAVIFTAEHSDKSRGAIREMRTATEMMVLTRCRPYPKDLGIDLLVIKEKRRRREPPLVYDSAVDAGPAPEEIEYDPRGNLRIGLEDGLIVAVHDGVAFRGRRWQDVFAALLAQDRLSLLDHAAYLGAELQKAELALRFGRSFEQDGPF